MTHWSGKCDALTGTVINEYHRMVLRCNVSVVVACRKEGHGSGS